MNPIKENIYYMKMLFDGRYYAKICKNLQNTYLVKQIKLPLNNQDYTSNNFQALHTLIIMPYQTFSFNQIFRYEKSFNPSELNLIASCINKLILNTPLSLIESHIAYDELVVNRMSKDFKFINNTPYKYQITLTIQDKLLYLNLLTEIKNARHKA